jgi:outer membrane protein TolC
LALETTLKAIKQANRFLLLKKLESKFNIEDSQFKILDNQKNNLILNIKAQCFSLIYAYNINSKKIILAQKRIDRLSIIDRFLSSINLTSPTKIAQAQITKNKIKLIKNDLLKLKFRETQLWNNLNIYLGFINKVNFNTPWLNNKSFPKVETLLQEAIQKNLNLQENKNLLKKYQAQLQYNRLEKMPDFSISLANTRSNFNGSSASSNSIGLSLSIPLINHNQEKILASQSQIKAQEYQIEFNQNLLTNELATEINHFQTNLKIADDFSFKIINQAIARLNQANLDFKKGILEFITYIELDTQEYNSIDVALDTQVQLANNYSNLMIKIGNFIIPNDK